MTKEEFEVATIYFLDNKKRLIELLSNRIWRLVDIPIRVDREGIIFTSLTREDLMVISAHIIEDISGRLDRFVKVQQRCLETSQEMTVSIHKMQTKLDNMQSAFQNMRVDNDN